MFALFALCCSVWASLLLPSPGSRVLSCSVACGISPDQGSNLGPLHWQWLLIHWATREVPELPFKAASLSRTGPWTKWSAEHRTSETLRTQTPGLLEVSTHSDWLTFRLHPLPGNSNRDSPKRSLTPPFSLTLHTAWSVPVFPNFPPQPFLAYFVH